MPLQPNRLKSLREAKGLSQHELGDLAKLSHSAIAKIERGKSVSSSDTLEQLADALDATTDYLYGRTYKDIDCEVAAARMSFEVFVADPAVTDEQRDRCSRVLDHPDVPKTARAWRSFAEMIDLAIGTTPSTSEERKLALVRKGQPKLKK